MVIARAGFRRSWLPMAIPAKAAIYYCRALAGAPMQVLTQRGGLSTRRPPPS